MFTFSLERIGILGGLGLLGLLASCSYGVYFYYQRRRHHHHQRQQNEIDLIIQQGGDWIPRLTQHLRVQLQQLNHHLQDNNLRWVIGYFAAMEQVQRDNLVADLRAQVRARDARIQELQREKQEQNELIEALTINFAAFVLHQPQPQAQLPQNEEE